MKQEFLKEGMYYHIYNRGNNRRDLFLELDHFEHFLALYEKFISPIAETLAWVLMPNHFHLVVKIKENMVYKYAEQDVGKLHSNADNIGEKKQRDRGWFDAHKWETVNQESYKGLEMPKKPVPHRHFAHLFNAYARYFNKRTDGTGNLFERPFKRKLIHNEEYLKQVILYVHNNPIHHGFCSHLLEYPWSSYISFVSEKPTKLKRESVLKLFNEPNDFKNQHDQKIDIGKMNNWLELDKVDYTTKSNNQFNAVFDFNAVRSGDADRLEDETTADSELFNAVRSNDADRLEDETTTADLSACEAPDNVGLKAPDNVGLRTPEKSD
ncbi:MAG: hypothetical protein RBS23_09855 [Mariniphaga sp.]|jgi:REP element-mobilizing transposase RayT|nr:hypothetical protein [Mariniphaga sp.]